RRAGPRARARSRHRRGSRPGDLRRRRGRRALGRPRGRPRVEHGLHALASALNHAAVLVEIDDDAVACSKTACPPVAQRVPWSMRTLPTATISLMRLVPVSAGSGGGALAAGGGSAAAVGPGFSPAFAFSKVTVSVSHLSVASPWTASTLPR